MLTVKEVYEAIDAFAPFASQESWDNSGLLVGGMAQPADRILTTLDISEAIVAQAVAEQVQLVVAHHPVIFSPLKTLPPDSPVYQLVAHGIAAICVHTPLDMAPLGLNPFAHTLRKIAYCSGSAASMLELAAAKGCDALITGDIKHDRWYAAEFAGIALFDCGHYGTERFAAGILAEQIRKALPAAQVTENAGRNPAEFCRGVEKA